MASKFAKRLLGTALNVVAPLALALAVLTAWLPAVSASPQPAPLSATTWPVSMVDNAFSPQTITIQAGDTVVWANNGQLSHTTTSDTNVWNSGFKSPSQTFSYTFVSAGTYPYRCTIHGSIMTGTVVVQTSAQTTATATATSTGTITATPTSTGTTTVTPTATPTWTPSPTGTPQTPTATPTLAPTPVRPTILISIVDNRFLPSNISVSTGAVLVWTNNGAVQHTVTSDTGIWDSGALSAGQTFTRTVDSPGTYYYHCNFHQGAGMVGVITASGASLATPTPTPTALTATPTPEATPGGPTVTPTPAPFQPTPAPTPLPPGVTPFPNTLPATGEISYFPWAVLAATCLFLAGVAARIATRR